MSDITGTLCDKLLVASRIVKHNYVLFIALIGLLPDVDALLRTRRWVIHSIIPVLKT